MFQNTSKFRLEGDATNNVLGGDQYNNCRIYVPAEKVKKRGGIDGIDKELAQFEEIIRGNIRNLRTILDSEPYLDWEQRQKPRRSRLKAVRGVKRTIFTANVCPAVEGKASKVTVMTYRGRNARIAWKKDFRTYSHLQSTDSFQLFGINSSEIPALIFHSELLPLAHFHNPRSFWMNLYVSSLANKLNCNFRRENLWIDTTAGNFISGPTGPHVSSFFRYPSRSPLYQVIPTTTDMLNHDVLFRYFSKQGPIMDEAVVAQAEVTLTVTSIDALFPQLVEDAPYDIYSRIIRWRSHYLESLWYTKPRNIPTDMMDIIRELDFTTVYSGKLEPIARCPANSIPPWIWTSGRVSSRRWPSSAGMVLDNGLTRFNYLELNSSRLIFEGTWGDDDMYAYSLPKFKHEIAAQLPWIVNGIKGIEKIVILKHPLLSLQGFGDDSQWYDGLAELFDPCDTAKGDTKPIYLFICPAPTTVHGLIAWETGRTHFWSFDENGQSEIPDDECKEMGLPTLTPGFLSESHDSLYSWTPEICDVVRDWQIARGFDPMTVDFARHLGYPEYEIVGARNEDKSGLDWLWSAFSGSDISACLC
ncbi:hypothetical protein Moror_12608 [Moniliophthora roreri MCA 2997]|uniref:Uncharacterized protein n=2 Tax=Moniliophthora roreri TaxID=221103 RepID=V2XS27_MONRO|nr:hypothetical protein Moror_12608 [Moniliophthora roreri MCA 2997]KAI3621214.1 hypothetical protein WG66_014382 [Moniliophthora roreri]